MKYTSFYKMSASMALACLLLTACASCVNDPAPTPQDASMRVGVGDRWPAFDVTTTTGERVTADSLLGRVGVVVLFHTSCPDCQRELPVVDSLFRSVDPAQCRVLAIARAEDEASIAAFWSAHGMTLPVAPQPDRAVYERFALSVIPRIYIASADGLIRYTHDDQQMPSLATLQAEVLK